jgi:hypothetical protein
MLVILRRLKKLYNIERAILDGELLCICIGILASYNVCAVLALFVLLKSQAEKYCSLICCERKTLFHG